MNPSRINLKVAGITAAYLNQTVEAEESRQVMRQMIRGRLKCFMRLLRDLY